MQGKIISNNIKQLIIGCECGCEQAINIVKYKDVNDYYITITSGLFYERQRGTFRIIKDRIKACWYILRGKEYLMCDININKKDIDEIIKGLNELKNEE